MTKKSKITNLIVMPLIASAVFLASPALAANPLHKAHTEVRNITNKESIPNTRKGIVGTVISTSGTTVVVVDENDIEYTVDTSHATIMKALETPNTNPEIVETKDIKVGDAIVVRGVIEDSEF